MAATHTNQKLTLNTLEESGRQAAGQLMSHENLFDAYFWLWLCIAVIVCLLSGWAYATFYVRKRNTPTQDTPCMDLARDSREVSDEDRLRPSGQLMVPARYREVFVQTMEEDLSILNQALREGRSRAVLSMLHRMHGALAAVSATELAERCAALGRRGSLHGINDELRAEIADLARDLMSLIRWQHTI